MLFAVARTKRNLKSNKRKQHEKALASLQSWDRNDPELLSLLELALQLGSIKADAVKILCEVRTVAALPLLLDVACNTYDCGLSQDAERAIVALGSEAIPAVVACMQNEGKYSTAPESILGELGEAAVPSLRALLAVDQDERVLFHVIEVLEKTGTHACLAELSRLLQSANADIRERVARCLGRLGGVSCADELLALLGDPSSKVRTTAVTALGELGATQAVAELAAYLARFEVRPLSLCQPDRLWLEKGIVAGALQKLQYQPTGVEEEQRFWAALRDWDRLAETGWRFTPEEAAALCVERGQWQAVPAHGAAAIAPLLHSYRVRPHGDSADALERITDIRSIGPLLDVLENEREHPGLSQLIAMTLGRLLQHGAQDATQAELWRVATLENYTFDHRYDARECRKTRTVEVDFSVARTAAQRELARRQ